MGVRRATSVGGTVTGQGGDFLIVDDPVSPQNAASEIERENANEWYRTTFYSRLNQADIGVRIIIMQRVHEKDLTGQIIEIKILSGNQNTLFGKICNESLKKEYAA